MCRHEPNPTCRRVGYRVQRVQKYEKGTNRISADRLHAIAREASTSNVPFFTALPSLSASDDEIIASIVKWMGQDADARQILAQLSKVRRADLNLILMLVERLAK